MPPAFCLPLVVVLTAVVGCTPRPGAEADSRYLVVRVFPQSPDVVYRAAYDQSREQGWGIRARDRVRFGGREFLAVTPGNGQTVQAQVSVTVTDVEEGSRVLVRSEIEAPPDAREVPAFLAALAARLDALPPSSD